MQAPGAGAVMAEAEMAVAGAETVTAGPQRWLQGRRRWWSGRPQAGLQKPTCQSGGAGGIHGGL